MWCWPSPTQKWIIINHQYPSTQIWWWMDSPTKKKQLSEYTPEMCIYIYICSIPYRSKHLLRRYLTLQIIPQTTPKKVLGSSWIHRVKMPCSTQLGPRYPNEWWPRWSAIDLGSLCPCDCSQSGWRLSWAKGLRNDSESHAKSVFVIQTSAKTEFSDHKWSVQKHKIHGWGQYFMPFRSF